MPIKKKTFSLKENEEDKDWKVRKKKANAITFRRVFLKASESPYTTNDLHMKRSEKYFHKCRMISYNWRCFYSYKQKYYFKLYAKKAVYIVASLTGNICWKLGKFLQENLFMNFLCFLKSKKLLKCRKMTKIFSVKIFKKCYFILPYKSEIIKYELFTS